MTNLLEFLEDVTLNLDKGRPVDVIYLDFAKAFDTVAYERLFVKLLAHGISGQVLQWVKSWLVGRRQKVGVNTSVVIKTFTSKTKTKTLSHKTKSRPRLFQKGSSQD